MNERFRQNRFGYLFENGSILKIDNIFLHAEVIKPALILLKNPQFSGAEEEFLKAHKHFRDGNYKESVTSANCAFESVMKIICTIKKWEYTKGARASDLKKILCHNNLFPTYLENSFDQLLAILSSGLPEVRNNEGGHEQGEEIKVVPPYIASYALHICASNIVFLIDAMEYKR